MEYFYGNKISDYGLKNGYVDYATFAKAFDAVMANDFMSQTSEIGYWEPINSGAYYEDTNGNRYTEDEKDDRLEELEERLEELEEQIEEIEDRLAEWEEADATETTLYLALSKDLEGTEKAKEEVEADIDALDDPYEPEVFQWFIIDDNGARVCQEANEIVYYNEALNLYLWGVTHWGTSWSYVLTSISCKEETV